MSAGAQFDWSKFGAKPVKQAFDWSKFGAKPVTVTSPEFDAGLRKAQEEKERVLQESQRPSRGFLARLGERAQGFVDLVRRNVAPQQGEANLLQRIAGPGPGIAQDMATGMVQAHREAGQEYMERAATETNPLRNVERFLEAGVPVAGPLYRGFRKDIEQENLGGAAADLLLTTAPFLGPEAKIAGQATKRGLQQAGSALADIGRTAKPVQTVVKEAMALPPKAVFGVEDIFRGAAPTGKQAGFREGMYRVAGDLNEIGQRVDFKATKGGFRNPDMRPRAVRNAIDEYLTEMTAQERTAQIAPHAKNPVAMRLGPDAKRGLSYMESSAGQDAMQQLAAKAARGETLTLGEAADLATAVNQKLINYQRLPRAERFTVETANPQISGLKDLDRSLSRTINEELKTRGAPGIAEYEQRFSILSRLRDQIQARLNAAELERVSKAKRIVQGLAGGKKGIVSASQASVADVRMGDILEAGFRRLRESGVQPKRGVGTTPTPVRGLLPEGPTRFGPGEGESFVRGVPGQYAEREIRGLLTRGATPLTAGEGENFVRGAPAAATTARGTGGQFKKAFTSASGPQNPGNFLGEIRDASGVRWMWTGERWWRMR